MRYALPRTRDVLLLAGTALCGAAHLAAQDERVSAQPPLQTELLAPLDAGRLRAGSPVLAKVLYRWSAPGCSLDGGSTVSGKIVEAAIDKAAKTATISVRFETADCDGRLGSHFPLRIYAMIVTPPVSYERAFADRGGLFGSYSPRPAQTMGGGPPVPEHRDDLLNDMTMPAEQVKLKLPKVIQAGNVFGAKKLSLEPSGPDGASVVRSSEKSLRLETGTKLVLMPMRTPTLTIATAMHASPPAEPRPAAETKIAETKPIHSASLEIAPIAVLPKDETDVCSTACSKRPGFASGVADARAGATLSMAALGYARTDRRELYRFHHAYTLTYIDASHLLFTFDLHKMRLRQTGGLHPEYVHAVRAVLIDPATHKVQRVVDWQVTGEEQYLWPAGPGHVLVHLGRQLRLLGPDLQTEHSVDVGAPLAWVAAAPGGSSYAMGLLRERHTPEMHRQLQEITGIEPEESIAVTLLDATLQPLGTATQPSTVAPPVLFARGELRVLPMDQHQWELEAFGFDRQQQRIATVVSDCQPRASLPTADTVFLAGCARGQSWYRAVRLDGHTVVRGAASSQQFEQAAEGDGGNDAFAVRVVWSAISRSAEGRFKPADLRGEQIAVYRADNGQRLLLSRVNDVPLAEQSFALAPDARQLAVLGTTGLYLYAIGTQPAAK